MEFPHGCRNVGFDCSIAFRWNGESLLNQKWERRTGFPQKTRKSISDAAAWKDITAYTMSSTVIYQNGFRLDSASTDSVQRDPVDSAGVGISEVDEACSRSSDLSATNEPFLSPRYLSIVADESPANSMGTFFVCNYFLLRARKLVAFTMCKKKLAFPFPTLILRIGLLLAKFTD